MTLLIIHNYKQPKLVPELELDNFFKNNYPTLEVLSIDNHSEAFLWDYYKKAIFSKDKLRVIVNGENQASDTKINSFLFKLLNKNKNCSVFAYNLTFPEHSIYSNIQLFNSKSSMLEAVKKNLS